MANDNNNLPDQSSMVRPMFTMAPLAHRELLLVGRKDLKWKGPSFDIWLKDVELNIQLKKYSEESDKIAQLKSQLETECGEVPDIINANANFFAVSTFQELVDLLRIFLNPPQTISILDAFDSIVNEKLSSPSIGQQILQTKSKFQEYFKQLEIADPTCKVSDKIINTFVFSHIYATLHKNSAERKDFQKFYDIQLSIAEQTKKFYEKSPNILGKQKSLPQVNAAFTQQNPSQPAYNYAKPLQQYQKERNKPFRQNESSRPQYSQQTTYQPTSRKLPQANLQTPKEQPKTIYCFNCERSAHSTQDCIYQAYCRLCRNQHKRGTRKKCLGSKWKPLEETQPIPFKYILQSELEKIKNGTWNETQPPRIQQQQKGTPRQNRIDFHTHYANAEDEEEEQDEAYPHILSEVRLGPEENDPNLQYDFAPTPDQTHDPEEQFLNF